MSAKNCRRCDRPWSEHSEGAIIGVVYGSKIVACPAPAVDWRERALAAEAAARGAPSTRAVCPCGCVLGWKFNGGDPGWFVMGACERCALPAHEVLS